MKHRLALPAILMAGALSLAACAAEPAADPSASATAAATATDVAADAVEVNSALAAMTWTDNGEGAAPTVSFDTPINFDAAGTLLVEDGDGAELEEGQYVALNYVQFAGADGSALYSTYDAGAPEAVALTTDFLEPTLHDALVGAHVGAKLLWAVPDSGSGSVVIALTVSSDIMSGPEGDAVASVEGLPQISEDADGAPAVDFTGATMPTELVSQDLVTGSGEAVAEGQTITVNYTGWVWDGDTFDSSFTRGAPATFQLSKDALIDGWVDGLAGKTVGSRVLLVIPPELGYGDAEQGSIPAGSTLVFVIDILAAY